MAMDWSRHSHEGKQNSTQHAVSNSTKMNFNVPQLEAYNEGRNVLFVSKENVGKSPRRSCQLDDESEAVFLCPAANVVRDYMLRNKCIPFSGSFTENCQKKSVPQSLLTLIAMIMYGTNIKDKASYLSQPALSLSQLMMFNSISNKERRHCRYFSVHWYTQEQDRKI